jgi:hypothetical protein
METTWIEVWTNGPQGAMRVLCDGDIKMGDDVEMTVVPVLIKSLPERKGSFKFLPDNFDFQGDER